MFTRLEIGRRAKYSDNSILRTALTLQCATWVKNDPYLMENGYLLTYTAHQRVKQQL